MDILNNKMLLSPELTEKILRSMQEGLLILDSEDQVQNVNEAALSILGVINGQNLKEKNITEIFAKREEAYDFLIQLEKEKHLNHQEIILKKVSGETIFCLLSASIIQDSLQGDLLKVIIFQDITERKQAELKVIEYSEKLEQSNSRLDQFAYIVSHDLKAPLRAISNLTQWLYEDLEKELNVENKKNLDLLKGRVMRIESLINGILEYSKIGRTKVDAEVVNVAVLIHEVLDLLVPPPHFKICIQGDMPVLNTPKVMLHQVFSNLISNAVKYNDKEIGMITIEVSDLPDHYQFSVHDNGPGIPREYHEKAFVIFQTLQARDKIESTGIGLTIVKRIVEEQGGKIWIDQDTTSGARFIFLWSKNDIK